MSKEMEIEKVVLSIWKEVLNLESIDIDLNLITLGGQSIDALKIANECQRRLQRPVTMVSVLRCGTLSSLVKTLSEP